MNHPLHVTVAQEVERCLNNRYELVRDPACGGRQHVPLFLRPDKALATRMCCVDLLIVSGGQVRAIVEVEESDFRPTKICGKFFQAALATHFIHHSRAEGAIPYAQQVTFIQVIDGSSFKPPSRKPKQIQLIEKRIRCLLPLGGITKYHLVLGKGDQGGLSLVSKALAESCV